MASPSSELRRLSKDLNGIPKDLRKKLRPAIKKAAMPVLQQAKRNASWSRRIPKATRVATRFAKRDPHVAIIVNRKRAPHSHAYENKGKPGTFRHPVFGNRRNWVTQEARPFLAPAVRAKGRAVESEITKAVDDTTRAAGFR